MAVPTKKSRKPSAKKSPSTVDAAVESPVVEPPVVEAPEEAAAVSQPAEVEAPPAAPQPTLHQTKRIGLSLGADICWAGSYEEILKRLNLRMELGHRVVDLVTERLTVEPYDLKQPVRYDVVIDRLTHWFHTSREWIKKAVIMDGLYVLNNPWAIQGYEKHTTYAAMMKLGLNVPETWMIPPKERVDHPDVGRLMNAYGRPFDVAEVGRKVGYPCFIKPYDGGAWVGVTRVKNDADLRKAYNESGQRIMHLQASVENYDLFVRTVGIGPQCQVMKYDPTAPLHARYEVAFNFVNGAEEWQLLVDQMMTINSFFGWEFNSCESLRKDGVYYPIDFANACPDFQVTSLHFYFPNLVKDMLRWSIFCAATERKMQMNQDWTPYYAVAKKDLPFRERLSEYARIGRERLEADRFQDFCDQHLGHLDEVVWEFFGTPRAHELVREKVTALFPAHEVDKFTAHYWGLLKFWRRTEADRLAAAGKPVDGRVIGA